MVKPADLVNILKGLFMGPQELVGVDIGSHSVKVVWLSCDGKTCRLKSWGHAPLQFRLDAPPEEKKLSTTQLIKGLFERGKISQRAVATSVSGNAVIVRYVAIPKIAKKDLSQQLPNEAEPFIPFGVRDVQLSCHIFGEAADKKKMNVALVAARKELISERVEFCVAAGLNPLLIDVDAFALESVYERLGIPGGAAILNIGNKQTNLAVLENGVTRVVRDVLIGGGSFTKTISKNLSVDLAMAEEIKRRVGVKEVVVPAPKPPPPPPISPGIQTAAQTAAAQDAAAEQAPPLSQDDQAAVIIAGIARDLAAEARRSIDFYISQASGRTVEKVYITGGGAVMPNLAKFLETEIKLPVEILTPLSVITSSDAEPVPPELAPALTVAAGLAMRKFND